MTIIIPIPVLLILIIIGLLWLILSRYRRDELKSTVDREAEFLQELIDAHTYWSAHGEKEYADAYKVLINKFSQLEND